MRNWVKKPFYKIIKTAIRQVTFLIFELQWLIQNRFEAYKIEVLVEVLVGWITSQISFDWYLADRLPSSRIYLWYGTYLNPEISVEIVKFRFVRSIRGSPINSRRFGLFKLAILSKPLSFTKLVILNWAIRTVEFSMNGMTSFDVVKWWYLVLGPRRSNIGHLTSKMDMDHVTWFTRLSVRIHMISGFLI